MTTSPTARGVDAAGETDDVLHVPRYESRVMTPRVLAGLVVKGLHGGSYADLLGETVGRVHSGQEVSDSPPFIWIYTLRIPLGETSTNDLVVLIVPPFVRRTQGLPDFDKGETVRCRLVLVVSFTGVTDGCTRLEWCHLSSWLG